MHLGELAVGPVVLPQQRELLHRIVEQLLGGGVDERPVQRLVGRARGEGHLDEHPPAVLRIGGPAREANEELYRTLVEAATEQLLRYSEAELALLCEYHRASRALTEAHAERVRSLLSERAQEGEAAS